MIFVRSVGEHLQVDTASVRGRLRAAIASRRLISRIEAHLDFSFAVCVGRKAPGVIGTSSMANRSRPLARARRRRLAGAKVVAAPPAAATKAGLPPGLE
jgi:hypothetical protein